LPMKVVGQALDLNAACKATGEAQAMLFGF
jgi:hypothetical protein